MVGDPERRRQRRWGEEDRISELPDALRLQILSLLPLKSAIRTGALSSRWRGLWEQRWPDPSSLDVRLPSGGGAGSAATVAALRAEHLATIDRRGRRRMDCLSLAIHAGQLAPPELKRFIEYAAACDVEEMRLRLDGGGGRGARGGTRRPGALAVHFPIGSKLLARLSVRGLHLTASANAMVATLEVIHFHSVSLTDAALRRVVSACPRLRELELRYCRHLRRIDFTVGAANLRNLTVVDCSRATELRVPSAPRLRSFRFSGAFLCSNIFGSTVDCLEHLYLCSGGPETGLPRTNLPAAVPRLSNLTVLTLCSIALQVRPGIYAISVVFPSVAFVLILARIVVCFCLSSHHCHGEELAQLERAPAAHVRNGQLQPRRYL
ncbi:hypothetical protein E2562_038207 [Oryza meyeriana var. granulata]|uniref:Uncharacterized protein n=1 Tax=Oryza meyeriana var. granulata TaxID=110450 RepID=A0A6G1FGC0_9ORYZ|nr:hypothetical protein E2562_038207 [Oryza meyeriana var. granulata]